MNQENVIV